MGMYDSIDRLVNMCDEVIESDPPGLRQKVVARYMTAFGEIIERETGTRVKADVSPGMLITCYRRSTEKRRSKILETARDQAELSQAQPAAPEGEGLEADQIRSA